MFFFTRVAKKKKNSETKKFSLSRFLFLFSFLLYPVEVSVRRKKKCKPVKKKPFHPVRGLLGRYTSRYAPAAFSSARIAASGPSNESTETLSPFFSALE